MPEKELTEQKHPQEQERAYASQQYHPVSHSNRDENSGKIMSSPAVDSVEKTVNQPATADLDGEVLTEESNVVLVVEAEDPFAPDQDAVVSGETERSVSEPESEPEPSTNLEARPTKPEVEASLDIPVTAERIEAKMADVYEPKPGDTARLDGEMVRLERAIQVGDSGIGYEIMNPNGTTSLVYTDALEMVDPALEKIRIEAEVRKLWLTRKAALRANFDPAVTQAEWGDLDGKYNYGVTLFTDPETANEKRNENRVKGIIGIGAVLAASLHYIKVRNVFAPNSTEATEKQAA